VAWAMIVATSAIPFGDHPLGEECTRVGRAVDVALLDQDDRHDGDRRGKRQV